jgi:hypothetical protein
MSNRGRPAAAALLLLWITTLLLSQLSSSYAQPAAEPVVEHEGFAGKKQCYCSTTYLFAAKASEASEASQ